MYPGQHVDLEFAVPELNAGKKRSFVFVSTARYERIGEKKSDIAVERLSKQNIKDAVKPTNYKLSQDHPNPFNPTTIINYQLPEDNFVTLKIYDVLGREVAKLVDEFNPAGYYEVTFDASQFSSGVYFYSCKQVVLRL